MQEIESIIPFALSPWEKRIQAFQYVNADKEKGQQWDVCTAVSSSARNDVVGVGGVMRAMTHADAKATSETFSFTLGWRSEQNPYSGELAPMAYALRNMPDISHRRVALLTTNKAVALSLCNPRQKSGQEYIRCIYASINKLWRTGKGILVFWMPNTEENELLRSAKREARQASKEGATPEKQFPRMKSTTLNLEKKKLTAERSLPADVGKHSKRVDAAGRPSQVQVNILRSYMIIGHGLNATCCPS